MNKIFMSMTQFSIFLHEYLGLIILILHLRYTLITYKFNASQLLHFNLGFFSFLFLSICLTASYT